MKQHNGLLLALFIITQSMATTHAMVRGGAVQAVQSAARSVQSMGALRMATSAQAVQQVVGRQAAHTFGVRNLMQDALSGVSKKSEKPKIEASEQEAFGTKQEAFVAKQEAFGTKQKKSDAQQEKIGEKVSQQSSVQDLIKAMGACGRDAYAGLRGCTKKAEALGLLAHQRYKYGKSMVPQWYADGKSVVGKKYTSHGKPVVDKLRTTNKKPALLIAGAVGLSAGAVGVYELAKHELTIAASPDSPIINEVRTYKICSLLMSEKKCLDIITKGKKGLWLLRRILNDKSTQDKAWCMVTNNFDIILDTPDFVWHCHSSSSEDMCHCIVGKLLENEGTRKKMAAVVLGDSIFLIGRRGGLDVLKLLLNYPEYKDAAQIILDNAKFLTKPSQKEQLQATLQKHGVGTAATEQIVGRVPERLSQTDSRKS